MILFSAARSRCFAAWLVLPLAVCDLVPAIAQAQDPAKGAPVRPVPYRRIGGTEYQNFLKNWDDRHMPLLCAVLGSPSRYEAWFHPAPLNRPNKAFAPAPGFYAKEQILVVARVTAGVDAMDGVFGVERVEESGSEVTLFYRFEKPVKAADYTVKAHLAVRIPQKEYGRAVFVENGKPVAALDLRKGEWSLPPAAPPEHP
jgi:hypothetical protein